MIAEKLNLPSLLNTRSLAGIKNKSGLTIKDNVLIRSGMLYHASKEDIERLYDEYQLRTIVDFRNIDERTHRPDPIYKDQQYMVVTIMPQRVEGITRENDEEELDADHSLVNDGASANKHMQMFYHFMATNRHCQNQFRNFLQLILKNETGAVLWHCSMGKDRCGMGTVLLLSALDVDENTIIEDYLYSNICLYNKVADVCETVTDAYDSVRLEYIRSFLNGVKKNYGNMDQYLEQVMGIGAKEKEILKDKYLIEK